jgi:hypothetical protein
MARQTGARQVAGTVQWLVGAVLLAAVAQCTIVGFRGGRIPIFGYRVRGTTGHGLLWLFIAGSFAFGIYVAVTVLADLVSGSGSSQRAADPPRQQVAEGS